MAKGWFRRKKGKLVYCWYNANGDERSKVVGLSNMTDEAAWLAVGKLGLDSLVNRPDLTKVTFGEVLRRYLAYGKNKTGGDKASSTKKTNKKNAQHLGHWSARVAQEILPVEIQEWLDGLSLGLRAPVRNLMSAVYRHGQKFGMIPRKEECNPIKWVSATTVTDYEAISLSPEESFAILGRIDDPLVRVLVIVVAVTAVRIGEALGLMWSDIDWNKLKIHIRRAWVYGELGPPKSHASKAPVEMHETLAALLHAWRQRTLYGKDSDFVFASHKLHGEKPRLGSMIVQDYVRPAAVAAGVIPEDCRRFGFHNLRHGLATYLMENGHDPFVVQRMLRHSNIEQTMHYVHNRRQARKAQGDYLVAFLPNGGVIEEKAPVLALSGGKCGGSEGSEIVSEVASAVE